MISPRIVSIHTPDSTDPESIVQDILSPGMTAEQRVIAIYEYCRSNTFHWSAPRERGDAGYELDVVFDVAKLLNVYGYSYCFAIRSLAEALYETAGFEAKSTGLGGHAVTEVYYEGRYHLLDHDQRGYSRLEDGTIAGVEDYYAGRARDLVLHPVDQPTPFFPATRRPRVPYEERHIFTGYLLNRSAHWSQHDKYRTTHSMNLDLRPGERFTRSWSGCGKWHVSPGLVEEYRSNGYVDLKQGPAELIADLYEQAPRREDGRPLGYANGLLVYRPDLSAGSTAFCDGAREVTNISRTGPGITPEGLDRPGYAEYRVRLPYVIVGRPGGFDGHITGACVVSGRWFRDRATASVRVRISTDGGPWHTIVRSESGRNRDFAVDVSNHVVGRYSFVLRFDIRPGGVRAGFSAIGVDVACQCNPAVLPAIRPGQNRMTVSFNRGPEVYEEHVRYIGRGDHRRLCVAMENLWIRKGAYPLLAPRRRGSSGYVVYRLQAPVGKTIVWARVGGAFRSHQHVAEAPDETYRISWSTDPYTGRRTVWEADRPSYLGHWCFEANAEVPLSEAVRTLYIRYDLSRSATKADGGGMVAARFSWGCEIDEGARDPVLVTHVYREDGVERKLSRRVTPPGRAYEFTVPGERVENLSCSVELAENGPATEGPHSLMTVDAPSRPPPPGDPSRVEEVRRSMLELDQNPTATRAGEMMLHHCDEWVRETAAAALLAIGGDESLAVFRDAAELHEWAEGCYLELVGIDGPIEELIEWLSHDDPMQRARAARELRRREDIDTAVVRRRKPEESRLVRALERALERETDPHTVAALAAALARINAADSLPRVLPILDRMSGVGASEVAGELARRGSSAGFARLERCLRDENPYVRERAAEELERIASPPALLLLRHALRDRSHWVRRRAVAGLAIHGGPEDRAALEAASAHEQVPYLRSEIGWAKVRLGSA